MKTSPLTRIGVFYDGNFFSMVSNYYTYIHEKKSRLSFGGLHDFIRKRVAHEEQVDQRFCQIVDIHYFRGRFSAGETAEKGKLLAERQFDDVLIREGVTTHYLPMGPDRTEKGIDVWFALEAYEMAIHKAFDVCVLVACDSDYLPLARKLNTLGTRVMVLGWDFSYVDNGVTRMTKTSQVLLDEVSYPILMSSIIEDRTQRAVTGTLFMPKKERRDDELVSGSNSDNIDNVPDDSGAATITRVVRRKAALAGVAPEPAGSTSGVASRYEGVIANLIDRSEDVPPKRFGWIRPDEDLNEGNNLYFAMIDMDEPTLFDELQIGTRVSFLVGRNIQGPAAKRVRLE